MKNSPKMTRLVVNPTGRNPSDFYSLAPYVKGQNFLRYLEDLPGGPTIFEPFFRYYIQKYKYKSVDSDDFKTTLYEYFAGTAADKAEFRLCQIMIRARLWSWKSRTTSG